MHEPPRFPFRGDGQPVSFQVGSPLLQTAGFIPQPTVGFDYLSGQAWYLSAMLLALVIAYPLAKHAKKLYPELVCPLVIVLLY